MSLPVTRRHPPLPPLAITFSVDSTAGVRALLQGRVHIEADDAFDLVSGSPARLPLRISEIARWAATLREAFPRALLFAHTAGIAHFRALAPRAGPDIVGIYYDYEPGYEPEFAADFARTVSAFESATAVAHHHDLLSVGYPTGRPLLEPAFRERRWNYAQLARSVDRLVVQTQRYCRQGAPVFAQAVSELLCQFARASPRAPPTLQVTIGTRTRFTPNAVDAASAYECARILTEHGLRSLYVWWKPAENEKLVAFLREIGRT